MTSVNDIVRELRKAQEAYYKDGSSHLTDKEYDKKLDALKEIFPDEYAKFMESIGSDLDEDNSHWEKFDHEVPLGSLDKCNTVEEFAYWAAKYGPYKVEEKLDGISIALYYENGELIRAVTRGNGEKGDDIFRNVKKMKGVKLNLSKKIDAIVRGEIVLKHSDFNALPEDQRGKNPRNTAAGAAKKLSGNLASKLTVIHYDVMKSSEDFDIKDEFAKENCVYSEVCENANEVEEILQEYEQGKRNSIDWDIDGLVIKAIGDHEIGDWRKPKNAIAWKFAHQSAHTVVREIIWQVSGERVNPVAIFEPVDIGGVTVSKASVHNWKFIRENSITSHAKVEVTRRNDVIPHVEQVLEKAPERWQIELASPIKKCPCCGGEVKFATNIDGEELEYLICTNPSCPAKAVKDVLKWFSVHDCKGVAGKTVELLYESIGFTNLLTFVQLVGAPFVDREDETDRAILNLDGMGKSKLMTLKTQMDNTRRTTIENFFGGLNINGFGRRMFRKVVDYMLQDKYEVSFFEVLNFIRNNDDMINVEGFSDNSIKTLRQNLEAKIAIINGLINCDFKAENAKQKSTTGAVSGKAFCFTGSLNTMKRKDAETRVKDAGGTIKSVSKGLDYLVTNTPESGTSKNVKAKKLGVSVITEEEFLELLK